MGDLSEIGVKTRLPVNIRNFSYLYDHIFESSPVYPAVESLQDLARAVLGIDPGMDVRVQINASFDKFLPLDGRNKAIEAFAEFQRVGSDKISAGLITRMRVSGSGMTRIKEHARICFAPGEVGADCPEPPDIKGPDSGVEFRVPARRIYEELVPMGPAYQNITGSVLLSEKGASADTCAPDLQEADGPLGSPFVLDAAFHAACVWGQRYCGFIGFPVGFARRRIVGIAEPGGKYFARAVPVRSGRSENVFDLWILGAENFVFEVVEGLRMRDVTGGRKKPPEWIRKTD